MHNEEGNVLALYQDIKKTMEELKQTYEIIFTNDASVDHTISQMRAIQSADSHFHFVDLEYNVGENWALLAGVSKARGEIIITIDGDYQNDPAYIPALLGELSKGFRVVSGRRKARVVSLWSRRLPSQIANGLIRWISGVPVHDCGCGLKVYRREVVAGKFVPKGFMNRFSPVALGVRGHEFSEVEIVDRPRKAGESHYGLGRVFIVLRDLWVLPFVGCGMEKWLRRFRMIQALAFGVMLLLGFWQRWYFAGVAFLVAAMAYSNVKNLGGFLKAQAEPNFRIREYR